MHSLLAEGGGQLAQLRERAVHDEHREALRQRVLFPVLRMPRGHKCHRPVFHRLLAAATRIRDDLLDTSSRQIDRHADTIGDTFTGYAITGSCNVKQDTHAFCEVVAVPCFRLHAHIQAAIVHLGSAHYQMTARFWHHVPAMSKCILPTPPGV